MSPTPVSVSELRRLTTVPSPMNSAESANLNAITAHVSRVLAIHQQPPQQPQHRPVVDSDESLDMALARADLGDGPLRFAPPTQYSFHHVLSNLSPADQSAIRRLQERWDDRQDKRIVKYGSKTKKVFDMPLQWHLRYLFLHAKRHKKDRSTYFSVEKAWNAEKKVHRRFLFLNIFQLQQQIDTKVSQASSANRAPPTRHFLTCSSCHYY
jgi:hypothetical protein